MPSATVTNKTPLLKRIHGDNLADPLYKRSRFLARIGKDTKFGGEDRTFVVKVSPTAGGSASFVKALANQNAGQEVRFALTHRKEYQVFSVQGDAIARSNGNKNAIVGVVKHESGLAKGEFFKALSKRAWGNGGGSLGQISSTVTGTTMTLTNRVDISGFEVNQRYVFSSEDGSADSPAALRDNGETVQVTGGINRATGAMTVTTLSNIAGLTSADYIFRDGDYAQAMTGMRGWCPLADPTAAESFFGVDRTDYDIVRTSGLRFTSYSGGPKEETLIAACAEAELNDIDISTCYVSPLDYRDLLMEMGSKRERDKETDSGISYRALELYGQGGNGVVEIVSDKYVPDGYFWMVNDSDIRLRTAGDCPKVLNDDGIGMLVRAADDDAYQGRLGAYGNFEHKNPGNSVIGTF